MHLRDLGVAAWKAPEGGFNKSAVGLLTMIAPQNRELLEPIPMCESEIALGRHLQEEHRKHDSRPSHHAPAPGSTVTAEAIWPVAKPAQCTPRSGTALEPYPSNEKRACRRKSPTSFEAADKAAEMEKADGMLVSLGPQEGLHDDDTLECPITGQKLSKGIDYQRSDPGFHHAANGKLYWGTVGSIAPADVGSESLDTAVDEEDLKVLEAMEEMSRGTADADKTNIPQLDGDYNDLDDAGREEARLLTEMEISMADLLTPRTAARSNFESDWNMAISALHSDRLGTEWDLSTPKSMSGTPRSAGTPRSLGG